MKRNIVIAAVTAAALIGGGSATALAVAGDDDGPARQPSARGADDARDDSRDDDAAEEKSEAARAEKAEVSAAGAVDAALGHTPGTAVSVDLDDDAGKAVWEVDVLTRGGNWRSVGIDPVTGGVLGSHAGDEDDTAEIRAALKGTSTSAAEAARAAAAKGTVTSLDLEDEDGGSGFWDAETRSPDGVEHDWRVDPRTGRVSPAATSDDD
ncbi:PepSY domain-containing protein [Streptomyces sp. NPDC005907]|uniref:PepSY domain-containing protein n=1 Tax=Streptomyces sp. NPDC005907 TaxID=3154571 RepID=UPI00340C0F63